MLQGVTYKPSIFDVTNLRDAREVILTPESGRSTDERWERETPYLISLVAEHLQLSESSVVLDYGCGVGRLSKELIARFGCRVIGVDISGSMRTLAEREVGSNRFVTCSPDALPVFGEAFADAAIAVWVLQHCPQLSDDLDRIRKSLKSDGQMFVVNEKGRCIPTDRGWVSDGLDIRQILASQFKLFAEGNIAPEIATKVQSERTFWAFYKVAEGANDVRKAEVSSASSAVSTAKESPALADSGQARTDAPSVTAAETVPPRPEEKRTFPAPAAVPTQQGPGGLLFDFNDGARVVLPDSDRPWRVRLSDLDTGNVLFDTEMKAGRINSTKRYFIRFKVEAWQQGESVFAHEYSAVDRDVLIQLPVGTLGDAIGWFPYAVKFKERHRCRLTCALAGNLIPLFREVYPDINFLTHEEVKPEIYYATYSLGLFFDDKDFVFQPCDFRYVGLHCTAGYILGVDPTEVPPLIAVSDDSPPIAEPYVCIAVQSTTQCKYWNNPTGWREIVRFLKQAGYRVVCIDQKPTHGAGLVWNHIPNGADDETGDRPLQERARWLKHAEFFVGLSSGLAWLAWAVGTPVVLISGMTHPTNEFSTPYRVINYHACNSCWNDPKLRFDHNDFMWCPRHKDTPRQFECTRLITADQVKATIRRIPGFGVAKPTAIRDTEVE